MITYSLQYLAVARCCNPSIAVCIELMIFRQQPALFEAVSCLVSVLTQLTLSILLVQLVMVLSGVIFCIQHSNTPPRALKAVPVTKNCIALLTQDGVAVQLRPPQLRTPTPAPPAAFFKRLPSVSDQLI